MVTTVTDKEGTPTKGRTSNNDDNTRESDDKLQASSSTATSCSTPTTPVPTSALSSSSKKKSGKRSQYKSRRQRDKENNNYDWRESSDATNEKPKAPKSKGISPKKFHTATSSKNTTSKLGTDFVQDIHAKANDSALRAEKNDWIKQQKAKRSALKDVTSLKTWPKQDMAMEDYQILMEEYLNLEPAKTTASKQAAQPDHEHGESSESCESTETKRIMQDKTISPAKSQLKNQFKRDFLLERSIPAHNVVTPTCDPANKFDSGLWSMEPRIFSAEKANGKRKYIVGHMGRINDLIWRKTPHNSRYFYELILEKTPCRLYFDLECSMPDNPEFQLVSETVLKEFYEELVEELTTTFPDHMHDFNRSCVVDLDSSTPQKFSRHWIIHLPSQALFKDTIQVGKFVKSFIQRLADQVATEQLKKGRPYLFEYLFVNPKDSLKDIKGDTKPKLPLSKKTCFVDLGVYTRNRLFRLIGSSKFGKAPDCALRLAETNEFPVPEGFGNEIFYVPAMGKTVSSDYKSDKENSNENEDENKNKDESDDRNKALEKFRALTDWSPHAKVLCSTLVVPMNSQKIDYPILPEILDDSSKDTKTINQHFSESSSTAKSTIRQNRTSRHAFACMGPSLGDSPYPYIDEFILNELANRGGIRGSIRCWTLDYYNENKVPTGISYQMSRNRWCECIGRSHKSNNIIWNVDFRTKQCLQSCYDPECRAMNFRGSPVDLPWDVVQKLEDALFEEEIAHMDDSQLVGGNSQAINNTPSVSQTQRQEDNFGFDTVDDADLETAMMALNLDEPGLSSTQETKKPTETRDPIESPLFDDFLSDDALLEAIKANPNLFP